VFPGNVILAVGALLRVHLKAPSSDADPEHWRMNPRHLAAFVQPTSTSSLRV
jgi:hypothetical protein